TLTLASPFPTLPTTFDGGAGSDTLAGGNVVNTWTVSAANGGSVGGVTFVAVENLVGNASTDTFKFTATGSLAGTVDGGAGTNRLDYSADGGQAVTANLQTHAASLIDGGAAGGFTNINALTGSSASD